MLNPGPRRRRPFPPPTLAVAALVAAACASGCSAFRPIDGVPATALSPEYRVPVRTGKTPLPHVLLGQPQPTDYRLDSGDVLAVYIDGMIGGADIDPVPIPVTNVNSPDVQPSVGYPLQVERNGTVTLPRGGPIPVRGRTLDEVRRIFCDVAQVNPTEAGGRVVVSLLRKRSYKVMVIRRGAGRDTTVDQLLANSGPSDLMRRGVGEVVELPAYENDVLHALTATGGMPSFESEDAVYVLHQQGGPPSPAGPPTAEPTWGGHTPPPVGPMDATGPGGFPMPYGGTPQIARIPLSLAPGEPPPFSPADVILQNGDVVYIESRSGDFFYTSGLFGGGQYQLPRDYDLDVLGAVAVVQAATRNSNAPAKAVGGRSALNKDVTVGASKLIILRPQPDGSTLPIEVDLYDAVHDPRQRVLIRPGDHLVLQYSRAEACAAFVERHLLDGLVLGIASSLFYRR